MKERSEDAAFMMGLGLGLMMARPNLVVVILGFVLLGGGFFIAMGRRAALKTNDNRRKDRG